MTQSIVSRISGAVLTVGGIALATFINAHIPDKTVLHLAVTAVAAIVAIIGIGIYEDAGRQTRKAADTKADKSFAPPHAAL